MIRLLMAGTQIAFVAVAMAVSIPVIMFAQTSEPATASEPVVGGDASPVQGASGLEDNTSVETNPPARMAIPAVVESETQRETLNQFAEYITWWAQTVTWWLSATAIFLTLFAVVVAIAGFVSFKKFREIEAEARKSVEAAKRYEADAKDHAERIEALQGKAVADVQSIRDLSTVVPGTDSAEANLAVKDLKPQLGRTGGLAEDLKQQVESLRADYREIAKVLRGV